MAHALAHPLATLRRGSGRTPGITELLHPFELVALLRMCTGGACFVPALPRVVALLLALGRARAEVVVVMTMPRLILENEVVMGTRKTSEGRFFLRPSPAMDALFLYCLARAVRITGVLVHEFAVLSNHYHVVFTDVRGNRPEFFRELNQFVARGGNRQLGRRENFFKPGSYNAPVLVDGDAIEDKCLYTLCNPVKHGLVKLPEYWNGISSWNFEYGQTKEYKRPPGFFAEDMRETEYLTLCRPEELYPELDDAHARKQLKDRATERGHALVKKIRKNGGRIMGMPRVRKQPTNSSPSTRPPRPGIRPNVAGKNKWARIEALQRNAAFLEDHRNARLRFEAGEIDVVFPRGTYLMAKRYGVAVCEN